MGYQASRKLGEGDMRLGVTRVTGTRTVPGQDWWIGPLHILLLLLT